MSKIDVYLTPPELVLGKRYNNRVPHADQDRQCLEVEQILSRLRHQPGLILADEVGMGKTFVALAAAYSIASQSKRGPVIVMVPANLVDKWVQDLKTFCELYLDDRHPLNRDDPDVTSKALRESGTIRYGVARHSVELMKLLDDTPRDRCHLIFLAQGAMNRRQSDKWIRLALIREALRRHGRGKAERLIQVKRQIHRYMAELLWAIGDQRASDWGDELWDSLLNADPREWKDLFNQSLRREGRSLTDDPVPEAVLDALPKVDMKPLAEALEQMPVRSRGGSGRDSERITAAREVLKQVEQDLWKMLLAKARWRSPLLVMDEAHHLKNPGTSLARQLQSPESDDDLKTGDGAMAKSFDRMLFLTATPFQLGHAELVRVMKRFGDVRWDTEPLGDEATFHERLYALAHSLNECQRTAISLQRAWSRLHEQEGPGSGDPNAWWESLTQHSPDALSPRQLALKDSFEHAKKWRFEAQEHLQPWIIRHNKGEYWTGTAILRRKRADGASILDDVECATGLEVPPNQILPFFLAARSAVSPGKDLLGDALCSSYEAFRFTREHKQSGRDDHDDEPVAADVSHAKWYLQEFDEAIKSSSGDIHPKVAATVKKVVDLWEVGEKVLVFAFYRHTCRALRIHISKEIERRMEQLALRRLAEGGKQVSVNELGEVIDHIHQRYFDDKDRPARRALDETLSQILLRRGEDLRRALDVSQEDQLLDIMRRFLRVQTTLVRSFPLHVYDTVDPHIAVQVMLDSTDQSQVSWRQKFEAFIDFLIDRCASDEREAHLDALAQRKTGGIRVDAEDLVDDGDETKDSVITLANVQVAMGVTKRQIRTRLMRTFNTPFFPDILVCSQVMGEGVDLQRYCRHVIHHDLAWNPSTIEQRTGRIDRLGCKAENRHPIHIYLPYISGTADERQYRVMTEREQWFRIVMGQDEVAKLIPQDADQNQPQLPSTFAEQLSFSLGLKVDASS